MGCAIPSWRPFIQFQAFGWQGVAQTQIALGTLGAVLAPLDNGAFASLVALRGPRGLPRLFPFSVCVHFWV